MLNCPDKQPKENTRKKHLTPFVPRGNALLRSSKVLCTNAIVLFTRKVSLASLSPENRTKFTKFQQMQKFSFEQVRKIWISSKNTQPNETRPAMGNEQKRPQTCEKTCSLNRPAQLIVQLSVNVGPLHGQLKHLLFACGVARCLMCSQLRIQLNFEKVSVLSVDMAKERTV